MTYDIKKEKQEFEKVLDRTGRYYMAYGAEYAAVGKNGLTSEDKNKIIMSHFEHHLNQAYEKGYNEGLKNADKGTSLL